MNVFTSLIKLYRSHQLKTPLEDFTTEIFVNILQTNPKICDFFVNQVLKIPGTGFRVSAQESFPFIHGERKLCIIDMVFRNVDTICFLENKVHAGEGVGQLNNYCMVLDGLDEYQNRYLRFCTKFYQDKQHITAHGFYQFRWCNIANFLSTWKDQEIINAFLEFLEINNMGNSTDFTLQEVLALENFNSALSKMDAYLEKIKPRFRAIFGEVKTAKNMVQLRDHTRHVFWKEYLFGTHYAELGVGFKLTTFPHLTVWIWTPEDNPLIEPLKELLKSQTEGFNNGLNYLELLKPLSDFISSEHMEEDIENWFMDAFSKIKLLSEQYPGLDWHLAENQTVQQGDPSHG